MRPIKHGSTDQSTVIRIIDSTDGTPEEAVEHNSAGIALWYRREGGLKVAITPVALTALDNAHSDGGIEHVDDGYYRLDVPDAAFASGAAGVAIGGTVTGMVVIGSYHPLVAYDPADATRLGLSALPNAAAAANGGLPTVDANNHVAGIQGTKNQLDDLNDVSTAQVNAEVVDVLRTDTIPDSYAADGSQPTIAQAVLAIHQFLQERAVSGTTVTVKKPDGSTTAMTFTLDDGTNPTSITRAT